MWFKHRAWIPIAWILSVANVGAVWFAALPGEAPHATIHAILAVLLAVGAQRLAARRRAMEMGAGAELPTDIGALRAQIAALRQGEAGDLKRLEQAVEAIAIELERVGEGQRFITKVLAEPARRPPSEDES